MYDKSSSGMYYRILHDLLIYGSTLFIADHVRQEEKAVRKAAMGLQAHRE